jgi:hypothetical protein
MKSVRAKFKCVYSQESEFNKVIEMEAVVKDNEDFNNAHSDGGGGVSLFVDKGTKAFDFFKPGQEYYLDFNETTT